MNGPHPTKLRSVWGATVRNIGNSRALGAYKASVLLWLLKAFPSPFKGLQNASQSLSIGLLVGSPFVSKAVLKAL